MPYHLYIANQNYSSWSMRPWVIMKTLEVPFEEHKIQFQETAVQKDFLRVSPAGKMPCLQDTDSNGKTTVVWDTLAIIEYLNDSEPDRRVWPLDKEARAFARCATAEMHSGFEAICNELVTNVGIRVKLGADEPSTALTRDLGRLDDLWREGIAKFGGPWLAGREFSAADAFFVPVAARLQTYGVDWLSAESMAYARRLLELPAVKEWIASALEETWRKGNHEPGLTGERKLLADYRKTV